MNIALSVINDGKTYQQRLNIIRSSHSDAWKFHAFCKMVCNKADEQRATFDEVYSREDISAATTEVFEYMERHWAEFDDEQKARVV